MKPHKLLSDSFLPVLLVVIVGAFLFSGMPITKDDLVIPTPTPAPDGGGGGGTNPVPGNPTPTPIPWAIVKRITSCEKNPNPIAVGKAAATGSQNGYISIEIDDGSGNFTERAWEVFTTPSLDYVLRLPSAVGYNSKRWKIKLFSGGSSSSGKWSGGELKVTENGDPTNCN